MDRAAAGEMQAQREAEIKRIGLEEFERRERVTRESTLKYYSNDWLYYTWNEPLSPTDSLWKEPLSKMEDWKKKYILIALLLVKNPTMSTEELFSLDDLPDDDFINKHDKEIQTLRKEIGDTHMWESRKERSWGGYVAGRNFIERHYLVPRPKMKGPPVKLPSPFAAIGNRQLGGRRSRKKRYQPKKRRTRSRI